MSSNLQRYLGGSPGSVLVRLLFLSLVVGAFLAFLDVTPVELLERLTRTFRVLLGSGFEAVQRLALWIAYGAMIVVPIWSSPAFSAAAGSARCNHQNSASTERAPS